jgi:hypothetical protein
VCVCSGQIGVFASKHAKSTDRLCPPNAIAVPEPLRAPPNDHHKAQQSLALTRLAEIPRKPKTNKIIPQPHPTAQPRISPCPRSEQQGLSLASKVTPTPLHPLTPTAPHPTRPAPHILPLEKHSIFARLKVLTLLAVGPQKRASDQHGSRGFLVQGAFSCRILLRFNYLGLNGTAVALIVWLLLARQNLLPATRTLSHIFLI